MNRRLVQLIAFLFFTAGIGAAATEAALIHNYDLNDSLADSLGGPSLISNGGVLGPTGLTFGPNEGPSLAGGLPDPATYSIVMGVSLDDVSSFRKLLDFKGLTSDTGLYNEIGVLNFYQVAFGAGTSISAGVQVEIMLTRDGATDEVTGAVNGIQQFSFIDGSGDAIFSEPGALINFLQDDFFTGQRESTGGFLDYIRIYDIVVPEPGSMMLAVLAAGPLVVGTSWRKRRRSTDPVNIRRTRC